MKYFLTPSTRLAIGLVLFAGSCCVSIAVAQPPLPPPPPPAPGVDSIAPVVEPVPIVHPSLFQDDLPPVRFGLSHQIFDNGIDDPFTDFRFFLPTGNDERVLFFDGRALFGNHMGVTGIGYNLGIGARAYSERMSAVWGINLFADRRQTALDRYHQVGFGTELLSETWELRSNSYLPTGSKRTVTSSEIAFAPGVPYFRENFISRDTLGTFQTFEQGLKGFDFEVGKRFSRLAGANGNWLVRGYAGAYYYDNPDLGDVAGVSLRLNANYRDAVEANLKIQNDGYFGTQSVFGVAVYFDGLFDRNQTFHSRTLDVRNHLARPVERKQLVTVARGSAIIGPPVTLDLTDPMTGNPITVTHIDSNGAGADLGTFEDPFLSLTSAAGSSTDLVYVYSDSTFDGEGYALATDQQLLGEGDNVAYTVDTSELGTIDLPVGNDPALAKPVINMSPGDAITLANNTAVVNFQINDTAGSGVFGDGVSNSLIELVTVVDSAGPTISLNDSSVSIFDSVLSTTDDDVYGVLVSGNSDVLLDNVQIDTMGLRADGVRVLDTSLVQILNGSMITVAGQTAAGVHAFGSSETTIDNSQIFTTAMFSAFGVLADESSSVNIQNGTFISIANGSGVVGQGSSTVSIDNSEIIVAGDDSLGVLGIEFSTVSITGGSTITTNGMTSPAVIRFGGSLVEIFDSNLRTTNTGSFGVYVLGGGNGRLFRLVNSSVTSEMDLEILAEGSSFTDLEYEIYGNSLQSGAGTVTLQDFAFGTLEIYGPGFGSLADFAASNGIAAGQVTQIGTISFLPLP